MRENAGPTPGPVSAAPPPRGTLHVLTDHRVVLAALFLLALGLRLLYLAEVRPTPFFTGLVGDEVSYDRWAGEIASGNIAGHGVFYQDPAYPYFLALLYSLFGRSLAAVYLGQALLSSLAVFLVSGIGRRSFDDRRVGLLAAALWATYKVDFFFNGQILKPTLAAFLVCAALWLTLAAHDRRSALVAAAAGFVWGLLLLVGGNFYFAAPAALGWLVFEGRGLPRRKLAALAGAWVLGFALTPGVSALRNLTVSGEVVLTTAQGGTNFYLANFAGNPWGTSQDPPFSRREPGQEFGDFKAEAERREGWRFRDAEVSDYWFRQALREMAQDPVLAALRVGRKALILVSRHELTPNLSYDFFRNHYSFILRLPLPGAWLAAPLGLAGLALALRRRKGLLPTLYVLAYASSTLVFYSYGRFRHPLVPALLVLAAFLIVETATAARKKEWRGVAWALALAAVTAGLAFPRWVEAGEELTWNKACYLYYNDGKYQEAIDPCRRALAINPDLQGAWARLGQSLEQRLRFAEAAEVYREAVHRDPTKPSLHYLLGRALQASGDSAGAAAEFETAARLKAEVKSAAGEGPEPPP